jgi:hypothetical protein
LKKFGEKRDLEFLKNRRNVEDYTSMMVLALGFALCTRTMFGVTILYRIDFAMERKSEYLLYWMNIQGNA